jgi:helix-turn-helix protein
MTDTRPDDLLTTEQAAEILQLSPNTLKMYRGRGRGPRFQRSTDGRTVRYRRADLDDYLQDMDAAVTEFARASVRMTDALSKINGADLDALLHLARLSAADDRHDRPAMAALWLRLADWLLLEFARRERPLPATPAPAKPAVMRAEPSPYL